MAGRPQRRARLAAAAAAGGSATGGGVGTNQYAVRGTSSRHTKETAHRAKRFQTDGGEKPAPRFTTEQLIERIEQGVTDLVTGDDWARYLDAARILGHRYSFNNQMLIWLQNPNATEVGSFDSWKKLGRFPRKGEKGLAILVPIKKYEKDENDEKIPGTERLAGFRPGYVFDVTQTEGEPLPEIHSRLEGEAPDGMIDDLHRHAAALGAAVREAGDEELSPGANGFARRNPDGSLEIVIRSGLSPAQKAKTFAHEVGHIKLGHLDDDGDTRAASTRSDRELEAESFAYLVAGSYGLDTATYSFGYTAGWSGGDPKRVREAANRIVKSAVECMRTEKEPQPA